jgi:peptide chain release factor 1
VPPKAGTTQNCSSKSRWLSTFDSEVGGVFDVVVVEERPGLCVLEVSGKRAVETFENEPGGHRWQRIPPTEKRGRVQTSTVTIAVLKQPTETQIRLRPEDLEFSACRGSGAGGQHRNVTDSAVILKHVPSGLTVRCESERSQHQNRETATSLLRARLWEAKQTEASGARAEDRRRQVGSGMRGDKRRTIRAQDGQVTDHITGKTWQYKRYIRGDWDS